MAKDCFPTKNSTTSGNFLEGKIVTIPKMPGEVLVTSSSVLVLQSCDPQLAISVRLDFITNATFMCMNFP